MGLLTHKLPTHPAGGFPKIAEFQRSHLGDYRQITKSAGSPGIISADGQNQAKVPPHECVWESAGSAGRAERTATGPAGITFRT